MRNAIWYVRYMQNQRIAVPDVEIAYLRHLADFYRHAAADADHINNTHQRDSTTWTLEALRVVGDTQRTITPLSDNLLFFGQEFARLSQTTMAAPLAMTPSAISRRVAAKRDTTNMADWWKSHTVYEHREG